MAELKFPLVRTLYVAYSNDGKVIHYGVTEPNQVTSTGQEKFEIFTKVIDCETKLITDLKVTAAKLIEQPIDLKIEPIEIEPIIIKR